MWQAAAILCLGASLQSPPIERPYIWTPKAGPEPRLTGPAILGFRPALPIFHRFTTTGKGTVKFTADRLPPGVSLDPTTGVLSGSVGFPGQFKFRVTAATREASDTRDFRLAIGEPVAWTPPMGVWVDNPSAVQAMATRLTPSGWLLAIAKEGDGGTAEAISQGRLRLGLRCESLPRDTAAAYLSFSHPVESVEGTPRAAFLHQLLPQSLERAAGISPALGAWRVGSSEPTWESVASAFTLDPWNPFIKQGRFMDPGPLWVGSSTLTPSEQLTQVTLWSLLSAPLIVANDPSALDAFALSLLTNHEVLAVNQDPSGRAARLTFAAGDFEVWSKLLEDQTLAIGVFNKGGAEAKCTLDFLDPSVRKVEVRDLWKQEKARMKANVLPLEIRSHGAMLFRTNKNVEFRFRLGHDPKPPRKKDGGGG